jgi:hypothetical protein
MRMYFQAVFIDSRLMAQMTAWEWNHRQLQDGFTNVVTVCRKFSSVNHETGK